MIGDRLIADGPPCLLELSHPVLNCEIKESGNIADEGCLSDERKGVRVSANLLQEVPDVLECDCFGLERDGIEDARIAHHS